MSWEILKNRDDTEVIAVDNASSDGTPAFLQSHCNWLTPVLLNQNTGIGGLNEGSERQRANIFWCWMMIRIHMIH
ncbi:MAG: glycosyltransferase [Desulfobacterales bacterium]